MKPIRSPSIFVWRLLSSLRGSCGDSAEFLSWGSPIRRLWIILVPARTLCNILIRTWITTSEFFQSVRPVTYPACWAWLWIFASLYTRWFCVPNRWLHFFYRDTQLQTSKYFYFIAAVRFFVFHRLDWGGGEDRSEGKRNKYHSENSSLLHCLLLLISKIQTRIQRNRLRTCYTMIIS